MQHAEYEEALRALGCVVERLPPADALPDSVFVEDAAVVLDEVAVITRPGAASRRAETASVAAALRARRPVVELEAPATLDGGDVLRLGRELLVGLSSRSDAEGARQLAAAVAPHGYTVRTLCVRGCLHLKTAVTAVADGVVIANPEWIEARQLDGVEVIAIDPEEPFAANALRVGDEVLVAAAHPRTRERLERRGVVTRAVAADELAKAEGGLTCCSLVLRA